jgi:hypothetical protein
MARIVADKDAAMPAFMAMIEAASAEELVLGAGASPPHRGTL